MFEELHILSVERQFISELYGCEKISQIFSCLERSILQLISFEGLYIRYENQTDGEYERLSGSQAEEAKQCCTLPQVFYADGLYRFRFPFGEEQGGRGWVSFMTRSKPDPEKLCSIERMLIFCSRSLYHFELLQQLEQYAKEQELLLRELRHRTHNNMQFLLSTLPYLVPKSEGIPAQLREDLEQRLHSLIVLSSIWDSQSISAAVFAQSYFVSVARTLRNLWLDGRGSLDLSLQVDESLVLSKEKATSIALIENELVTNTLKHSLNQFPAIQIDIRQQEDRLVFTYRELPGQEIPAPVTLGGGELHEKESPYWITDYGTGGQGQEIIRGLLHRAGGDLIQENNLSEQETLQQFKAWFPLA